MKKILSYLLVIALLLVQLIPIANAAKGTNDDTGSITISNALKGQTYSVYQILKLESYDTTQNAYTYKATSTWSSFVNSSAIKGIYLEVDDQGYVTWKSGADAASFSKIALQYAIDNSIAATNTITATTTEVEFTSLNLGYYLVDSSLGALCGLTTTNPSAEVLEKNEETTIKKLVKEGTIYSKENTAKVDDIVEYKTIISVEKGAQNYVLHDTMDEGLTYNSDAKVYVNDVEVIASDDTFTLTKYKNDTFTIVFNNTYVTSLLEQSTSSDLEIVVKYTAKVNEKAVICKVGECLTNDNDTYLDFGDNNQTNHDRTKTYVYEFTLIKTDKDNTTLQGAEFKLYDASTNGNEIKVFKVSDGLYRVAYTEEELAASTNIVVGSAIIEGLDENISYWLQEEVAPNGYNKLASRVEVKLSKHKVENNIITATKNEVKVVNNKGNLLPSTGGIGTVLFVAIGSIMVIGFGILLVTKLRLSKMSI